MIIMFNYWPQVIDQKRLSSYFYVELSLSEVFAVVSKLN